MVDKGLVWVVRAVCLSLVSAASVVRAQGEVRPAAQFPAQPPAAAPPQYDAPPPSGYTPPPYAPSPGYAPSAYAPSAPPVVYYAYAPPPPAPPAEKPAQDEKSWGIGAGIGFGDSVDQSISYFYVTSGTTTLGLPSYRLALERRLGASTWLTLNGFFGYLRSQQPVNYYGSDPEPESTRDTLEIRNFKIAGLLGLRQVLVRSVVDVSLLAAVGVGHGSTSGDEPREGESVSAVPGSYVNTLAFTSGFAVERQLIEALAVRLSLSVLSASTSRAELVQSSSDGTHKTNVFSTQSVDLRLSPAILLFFYF